MLIECQECHGKVSDMAKNCPHCGCPVKVQKGEGEVRQKAANLSEAVSAWCDEDKTKKWYDGRMSRSQYFIGWLVISIVCVLFEILCIGLVKLCDCLPSWIALLSALIAVIGAFFIYLGIPFGYVCLSVRATVRRIHDAGYTGWLILLWPLLGPVFFIVMCIWPSQQMRNQFGDVPMRI